MIRLVAAAFALAAFCGSAAAGISFEEEIPAFRFGIDSWTVERGLRGQWIDSGLAVSVPDRPGFTMKYARYPGMKPFRGADEIVLKVKSDAQGKATAELEVFAFPSKKGEAPMKFSAPISAFAKATADKSGVARFKTGLDPSKKYQIAAISIRREHDDGKSWKVAFMSLRGVFNTPKAEALRVEAATGNQLHIVREGHGEKPVLIVRNAAQERIAAHGVLTARGFFGDTLDLPVDIALDGGRAVEIPISGVVKKGVWRVGGELTADDGSVVKVDTRFAVMDYHGKTPKQTRGNFRLGVHWHFPRFTDGDRNLAAAAMVACGAKLTRADFANMASIQPTGPDCWEFARTDELLEMLETNGLAVDAIIFKTPRWAMTPPPTNAVGRSYAVWPPVAGTFGAFCERLAARYGTRIDYYEIGNEWDLRFGGTYDEAVAVQREAYVGLKKGCPDVCVIPNGWATAGNVPSMGGKGRTWIHEYFLKNAKDYFDVDTIHGHGPFPRYVNSITQKLFPLRERTGASEKPWYSNETALTSVWSERDAALTVWKKILWAWANGSVDYIWYNLRATGWDPKNPEHGYGLITADFRPRDSYVAFSALATVVGGAKFRRKVFDGEGRYWFEFERNGCMILTQWLDSGERDVSVRTDADSAMQVDVMGNRSRLPVANGKVSFRISPEPCAIVLGHATFADADDSSMRELKPTDPATVAIPPDSLDREPDFVLDKPGLVHDFFEGNPAEVKRLWTGPKDNSAKVWLAKDVRGLRIRVEVEDDRHCQPYCGARQYEGDGIQVALSALGQRGRLEFGFAHRNGGFPDVHCRVAPEGCDADKAAARVELDTSRVGTVTRYDALIPYAEANGYTGKMLEDGIRFNMMVNDNDGDGRDATIEIVPNAFNSKDMSAAPVVRFSK